MVQKGGILPITAHTVERLLYLTRVSEQWTILLQLWLLKSVLVDARLQMARKANVSAGVRQFPFKSDLNERLTKNIFPLPVEALHVVLECDAELQMLITASFLLRQTSWHRNLSLKMVSAI